MGPNQRLLFNSFGPLMSLKCRAVVSIKLKSSIKLANCGKVDCAPRTGSLKVR